MTDKWDAVWDLRNGLLLALPAQIGMEDTSSEGMSKKWHTEYEYGPYDSVLVKVMRILLN